MALPNLRTSSGQIISSEDPNYNQYLNSGASAVVDAPETMPLSNRPTSMPLSNQPLGVMPQVYPQSSAGNLTSMDNITSASLNPVPNIPYQTPNPVPPYPVSGLDFEPMQMTEPEAQAQDLTSQIMGLTGQLTGQAAFRAQREQEAGMDTLIQTQNDLTARLKAIQNEAKAIPLQMQQEATGKGITAGGLAPLQTARLRTNAIQALMTSSLLEASRGNITTAQTLVDRAVSQRFDPIKEEIAAKQANLELILKSPAYSLADKNRAAQQKAIQDAKAAQVKKEEDDAKAIMATATEAAKYGADAQTLKAIQEATTPQEAQQLAAPYLGKEYADKQEQIAFENFIKAGEFDLKQDEFGLKKDELAQKIKQQAFENKMDIENLDLDRAKFANDVEYRNAQLMIEQYKLAKGNWSLEMDENGNQMLLNKDTGEMQIMGSLTDLPADGKPGGQCGDFLHNILDGEPPKFGDTFQSKMNVMNMTTQQFKSNPQVGDILTIRTNTPTGHVAVVKSVNEDGTVTLSESNWGMDERVGTRTIKITDPSIAGAYRGAAFKTSDSSESAKSWANLVNSGQATIANVPDKLQNKVATLVSSQGSRAEKEARTTANTKIELIDSILNNKSGLNAAVGPNALSRTSILNPISSWLSGTRQKFISGVQQLIDQETLGTLLNLKKAGGTLGALSEGERVMLQSAASKIGTWIVKDKNGNIKGYNVTQKEFEAELKRLKAATLSAKLNSEGRSVESHTDGTVWEEQPDGSWKQVM